MLASVHARLASVLTRGRLRTECLRVLLLLRERFYLGLIAASIRRLRQSIAPQPPPPSSETVLAELSTHMAAQTAALTRIADAVESLARAHGIAPPGRPLPPGGVIASLTRTDSFELAGSGERKL